MGLSCLFSLDKGGRMCDPAREVKLSLYQVCWLMVFAVVGCAGFAPSSLRQVPPPVSREGGFPLYRSVDDAAAYVEDEMEKGTPAILLRLENGASPAVMRELATRAQSRVRALSVRCHSIGEAVLIEPQYSDDVLMLRAFREPSERARLSSRQQEALRQISAVVEEVKGRHLSPYDQALALHDYIVCFQHYAIGAGGKNPATVTSELILSGQGTCDGYTRLYHLMLSMVGMESLYVTGYSAQGVPHSWNLVNISGEWAHVDCTYDDPLPDVPRRILRTYFGMSDEMIASSHRWDKCRYPRASSSQLHWPRKRGLCFRSVDELMQYCGKHARRGENIVAWVEELQGGKVDAKTLLEAAQRKMGRNIIHSFHQDAATPAAIECVPL